MTTVNIPLVTLQVGTHDFGPAAVADTERLITLTINLNVPGGFNSQPATTTANLQMFQSNNNGATWHELAEVMIPGGTYGSPVITQAEVDTTLNPGTGREVKATLVVAGSSVAVSGSLTIT